MVYAPPGKVAAVWCAAPVNGLFAAFLHWLFSPRRDAVRLPHFAIAALLLVSLAAVFFGGIWFGESREFDKRERAAREEMETLDE